MGLAANACSLTVHACALTAAAMTWFVVPDTFHLAGQRNVLAIEMTLASRAAPPPVQIVPDQTHQPPDTPQAQETSQTHETPRPPQESDPPKKPEHPPQPDELPAPDRMQDPASVAEPMPAMEPAEVALTASVRSSRSARTAPHEALPAEVPETVREMAAESRPVQHLAENAMPPVAEPPPQPVERRPRSPRLTQPSVSVPQIAGIDDKAPPDFTGNRPPAYPAEAVRRGLEGTVLLHLWISATGRVERVAIVRSSGHAILDRAAINAVQNWRGRPARRRGREVASDEVLPVRFRL